MEINNWSVSIFSIQASLWFVASRRSFRSIHCGHNPGILAQESLCGQREVTPRDGCSQHIPRHVLGVPTQHLTRGGDGPRSGLCYLTTPAFTNLYLFPLSLGTLYINILHVKQKELIWVPMLSSFVTWTMLLSGLLFVSIHTCKQLAGDGKIRTTNKRSWIGLFWLYWPSVLDWVTKLPLQRQFIVTYQQFSCYICSAAPQREFYASLLPWSLPSHALKF